MNLQYNYAIIDISTGLCLACMTKSYEVINDAYIPVPSISNEYRGKYYDRETDLWYLDESHTIEADEINAMYHG
jgi:hypothetical protein